MKKKLAAILTSLALACTITAALPATGVQAASVKLTDGTTVDGTPIAAWVADGSTATLLKLNSQAGAFDVVLDSKTDYGKTKYVVPGEVIVLDLYVGSDNRFHAAKIEQNTTNANVSGAVAVGTDIAKAAESAAAQTTATKPATTTTTTATTQNVSYATGTIGSKSENNLIYLNVTNQGTMQIKLDANTDMSNGKVALIGSTYKVGFYNGGDGYLHAASLYYLGDSSLANANGNAGTVVEDLYGTVKSADMNMMTISIQSDSDMKVKLDANTDTSGCRVLGAGFKIKFSVQGSVDGYLHATKITDTVTPTVTTTEGSMGDKGTIANPAETTYITGTPTADSTDDLMQISVNGQLMKVRLDSNTKYYHCSAIRPGYTHYLHVYVGTDGYMHAADVQPMDRYAGDGSKINTNSTATFTGKVQSNTVNDTLYLKDSTGSVMTIRLDTTCDCTGARILRDNREIVVRCGHGSDGYWHAMSIAKK